MLKFSFLVVVIHLCSLHRNVEAFATPRSDFQLSVDESSVGVAYSHGCVLEQKLGEEFGGKAFCWGRDDYGRLDAPQDITFVQIITGRSFSCGITLEQTALCWGLWKGYQPGMYMQLTAGAASNFACGVMNDGRINCWGHGEIIHKMPLNEVPEVKYVQISCSTYHCCALDANAYPHCWGSNVAETTVPTVTQTEYQESLKTNGRNLAIKQRFSDNDDEEEDEEVAILRQQMTVETGDDFIEVISKVQFRQISVSDGITCGIMLIGSHLRCWGRDKLTITTLLPRFVLGPFRQVSVGSNSVCVISAIPTTEEVEAHLTEASEVEKERVKNAVMSQMGRKKLVQVTVLREPDHLTCWGDSAASDALLPSWDSVILGATFGCGVSMDSELACFGHGPTDLDGRDIKEIIVA